MVIILLTYIECKKKKEFRFVDSFLFGISVLAGLFLLFMWVGTDHIATAKNMNVLWLLPAQLLFLVTRRMDSLLGKKLNTIALIYQTLVAFILLLWPQDSEISFTFTSIFGIIELRVGGEVFPLPVGSDLPLSLASGAVLRGRFLCQAPNSFHRISTNTFTIRSITTRARIFFMSALPFGRDLPQPIIHYRHIDV